MRQVGSFLKKLTVVPIRKTDNNQYSIYNQYIIQYIINIHQETNLFRPTT